LNPEGSWDEIVHLVFIDQPIGTGFSYGEPVNTNMDQTSDEFVNFFINFFEKYPQFKGRDFYVAGESYAGKYVPRYTYALL
jgi:carboxypeptidase C (cathepsin A)